MHQVDLKVTFSSEWSRVQSQIREIFKHSLQGANCSCRSWANAGFATDTALWCPGVAASLLARSFRWPVGLFQLRGRAVFVFQRRAGVQRACWTGPCKAMVMER